MKYTVGIIVNGMICVPVEADSFEDAEHKARDMLCDDILRDVEYSITCDPVAVESENGETKDCIQEVE